MKLPKGSNIGELWRKYRYVVLVVLAGFVLMLLPEGEKAESSQTPADSRETFSLEETERRMEEILSCIEGTGRLQLMLTLRSGSKLQLAEDQEQTDRENEQRQETETVTLNRGSGWEDIVITEQEYPEYQGAVVVCQGADKAAVRLALTEAVAALTGLSSDRISIVKWNSK